MEKICLVITILITSSVTGLTVSNKICKPINAVTTVCRNVTLKGNQPLEIENCTKILKFEPPLQEIPPKVFMKLSHIEILISNYTLMNKIYSGSFDGLTHLKELDLYWNQISYIPSHAFHDCRNLTYLNLGGNDLENLNGDVFAHLQGLKKLIISSNLLSSVPKLRNLTNLEQLDLSRNIIKKLNKKSFEELNNLINLNLKGNQMFYIEKDAFYDLKSLRHLNLEKNNLDVIDVVNIRSNLPKLTDIRINMNDFSCKMLETVIGDFSKLNITIPEGLAEPGPISYHGIFCIPRK